MQRLKPHKKKYLGTGCVAYWKRVVVK